MPVANSAMNAMPNPKVDRRLLGSIETRAQRKGIRICALNLPHHPAPVQLQMQRIQPLTRHHAEPDAVKQRRARSACANYTAAMTLRNDELGRGAANPQWFATTHWSVVLAAGNGTTPGAAEALEKLCCNYWY